MRRLPAAEAGRFPDLPDIVQGQVADRIAPALANRLARLSPAGRLRSPDPLLAAEQFLALLPARRRPGHGWGRGTSGRGTAGGGESGARTFLAAFTEVRRAS
ncbi:TetR/AcrR family transcriptional regulator C-terminal domain-containing protein [Spirillospora sp. NPDC029432]|uniref:TetR/AcrR family transcriptional regulator C-terminal domain-containing protein n=1 Tax=Spirillospora sp. NPDC029432 TaxID=3154599 RepID=UPI003452850B